MIQPTVFSAHTGIEAAHHAKAMLHRREGERMLFVTGNRVIISDRRISDHHVMVGMYTGKVERAQLREDILAARAEDRRNRRAA